MYMNTRVTTTTINRINRNLLDFKVANSKSARKDELRRNYPSHSWRVFLRNRLTNTRYVARCFVVCQDKHLPCELLNTLFPRNPVLYPTTPSTVRIVTGRDARSHWFSCLLPHSEIKIPSSRCLHEADWRIFEFETEITKLRSTKKKWGFAH